MDDGPFGEAWHLLIVDLVAVENGQEPKVPLTSELYEEMNALAEQQCGYPVIEVMGAMAQQCFTQISDGSGNKVEREPTCHQRPDPRPAMGVGQ
ncbi:MAG: hypothetical protein GY925_29895 [Actinomycetia bacterium]|nr:hypothetical protein [Actinomycetes bacterium]